MHDKFARLRNQNVRCYRTIGNSVARKNRTTELERNMIYEKNKIRKKEFI